MAKVEQVKDTCGVKSKEGRGGGGGDDGELGLREKLTREAFSLFH
jgi:hypothetical protein